MFNTIRNAVLGLWIATVIGLAYYVAMHRSLLEPEHLMNFFQSFWSLAIVIFIVASFIRGIVLLPSTPLVLVWVLFFPDNPLLVFFISMLGIVFSGILIYKFSDIMWFDEFFTKYLENRDIDKIIDKYGFWAIVLWSFAPVVMTDLICYVAGMVRYNFMKFVLALLIGESAMVAILIWWGKEIVAKIGN